MNEYLSAKMLNDIENKISDLHILFKNFFCLEETGLRNIKIGDDLDNRILYLHFPRNSYESINNENDIAFINTDRGEKVLYKYKDNTKSISYTRVDIQLQVLLYSKNDNVVNQSINYIRYHLPSKMGYVTFIDNTDPFFDCIKIKSDKYRLLEYQKKEWKENEIPYLQDIDRIEEGINNIAELLYKPLGYIYKPWTTMGYYQIGQPNDYGLGQKPISKNDFNRWKKNIDLLKNIMNEIVNVWNVISNINWNEDSLLEWEDY